MKSVGHILKSERKKQNRTLVEIYQKTKIPILALKKIEADQFDQLPPATFTKGFLRSYAQSLGLDVDHIIAVFRRDFVETTKGRILPKDISEDVTTQKIGFNPRTYSLLSLGLLVLAFLIYFVWQLQSILTPPKISLDELPDTVTSEELTVSGKVNREAVITVNNELVLQDDKKFEHRVELNEGLNIIEVKAVDRRQKESVVIKEILLDKDQ